MKKKVIFLYDYETKKLIEVSDVRELTSDQFESFSKQAKTNKKEVYEAIKKLNEEKEKELSNCFDRVYEKIGALQMVVAHLLGFEELDDEKLKTLIDYLPLDVSVNEPPMEEQQND